MQVEHPARTPHVIGAGHNNIQESIVVLVHEQQRAIPIQRRQDEARIGESVAVIPIKACDVSIIASTANQQVEIPVVIKIAPGYRPARDPCEPNARSTSSPLSLRRRWEEPSTATPVIRRSRSPSRS